MSPVPLPGVDPLISSKEPTEDQLLSTTMTCEKSDRLTANHVESSTTFNNNNNNNNNKNNNTKNNKNNKIESDCGGEKKVDGGGNNDNQSDVTSIEDDSEIKVDTEAITEDTNGGNSNSNSSNGSSTSAVESQDIDIKTEIDDSFVIVPKTEDGSDNNDVGPPAASKCGGTKRGPSKKSSPTGGGASNAIVVDMNAIFRKPLPVYLRSVNPHIICNLCQGYLIDATTIVECLHSFCHSCIMRHLKTKQFCPRCEMMINTAKPNIKPDTTLQAIVYKLVPGLYEKELMRKRAFYKDRPEDAALATPEQRGEDTEHLIFSPSEYMSLSLEYADAEQHMTFGSDEQLAELLRPKYLQCPSIFTVANLKKFVYGKFEIDASRFSIDIMYKVKTIVLLDHYTLMDVAYIYTWKRDAPMRFFFRVKESPMRPAPVAVSSSAKKTVTFRDGVVLAAKEEIPSDTEDLSILASNSANEQRRKDDSTNGDGMETKREITNEGIKEEESLEENSVRGTSGKTFEIVSQSETLSGSGGTSPEQTKTDKLKIILVSKGSRDKQQASGGNGNVNETKSETTSAAADHHHNHHHHHHHHHHHQPKVENIKLKIDLSKQNSVTIIKMSDSERKESVKNVKPEKEWKVKCKKESSAGSPKMSSPSPLLVPPLTIKAERISPLSKFSSRSASSSPRSEHCSPKSEEDQKSQFLKSFSLTPIKDLVWPAVDANSSCEDKLPMEMAVPAPLPAQPPQPSSSSQSPNIGETKKDSPSPSPKYTLMGPPALGVVPKISLPSKRKSKEPVKAITKKPRLNFAPSDDFKIKLPPKPMLPPSNGDEIGATTPKPSSSSPPLVAAVKPPTLPSPPTDNGLMLPPTTVGITKPAAASMKKLNKNSVKFAPPGSLTPHPMSHLTSGIQPTPPGNRTPIAKRYQPILPKTARPNPFAHISTGVNKILKDAGTEIKSISSNDSKVSRVYGPGPKVTNGASAGGAMGPSPVVPPPASAANSNANPDGSVTNVVASGQARSSGNNSSAMLPPPPPGGNKANNNYLNLALFNATKSKGNEAPPGFRTPMYTPNSPIYSPNSPQYVPNYNIPTMPTYKYTPKPAAASNSFLQSVLGSHSAMSNLFPAPPTKKPRIDQVSSSSPSTSPGGPQQSSFVESLSQQQKKEHQSTKRVYPFTKSPSPVEDAPEKQLKVKSLLNSCNINIPSSLSITITREDSETPSNSASHPKHKSPVNNYIEILKLPDQSVPEISDPKHRATAAMLGGKQQAQPAHVQSTPAQTQTQFKKDTSSTAMQPSQTANAKPPMTLGIVTQAPPLATTSSGKNSVTIHNIPANTTMKSAPPNAQAARPGSATQPDNSKQISVPSPNPGERKTPKTSPTTSSSAPSPNSSASVPVKDKKTPSPEKKSANQGNHHQGTSAPNSAEKQRHSPGSSPNATSPKSSASSAAANNAKKFRPILPRSNAPLAEVLPRKIGPLIGTYTSPAGVPIKIHKTTAQNAKKAPNTANKAPKPPTPPAATPTPTLSPTTTAQRKSPSAVSSSPPSSPAVSKVVASTAAAAVPMPKPSSPLQANSSSSGSSVSISNSTSTTAATSTPTTTTVPAVAIGNNNNNNNGKNKNITAVAIGNNNGCNSSSKAKSSQSSKAGNKCGPSPPPPPAVANQLTIPKPPSSHNAVIPSLPVCLPPPPPPPQAAAVSSATHPMPGVVPNMTVVPHLGCPSNVPPSVPNQAELNKLFNDTILRAQVQAAAAANQFYPYATAAQYGSAVYNYQQAYIMEQFTRMRRAGDEAFAQYMLKLKNGEKLQAPTPPPAIESPLMAPQSPSGVSSTSASIDDRKSPAVATPPIDVTSCSPTMSPSPSTTPTSAASSPPNATAAAATATTAAKAK